MKIWYDEIVASVRKNREELLEQFDGIEGLHKHMEEERPLLEKEGWVFIEPPPVDKDFMAAVHNDLKTWAYQPVSSSEVVEYDGKNWHLEKPKTTY
jgi:hypothetical protein